MADTQIIKMEEATRYDENMTPKQVYVISFRVGDSGPFKVEAPIEGYTASVGRDAVNTKAQEISATLGI